MTVAEARVILEDGFLAAFQAEHPEVPVRRDNRTFRPPDDGPWIGLSVQHATGYLDAIGAKKRYIRVGTTFIQVFVPLNTKMAGGDALVDDVVDILEGAVFGAASRVRCYAAIPYEVGRDERWFQTNVTVRFDYDVVK